MVAFTKQGILQRIKPLTNSGRQAEAVGHDQRHFGLTSGGKRQWSAPLIR